MFRCRHGRRGSAVLKHWTIPTPIMPTLRTHLLLYIRSLNCELKMTSSGSEPKIYLRGVTPHTLIHGGLGHRPLLCEELESCGSYLDLI